MKIICKLSRARVKDEQAHDLDLLVRLRAPAPTKSAVRPPLALMPVVDVSGSMAGDKLASVRRALVLLVDHLVPGDRIGIVAFDSEVRVAAPLVEVTEAKKVELRTAIRSLVAGSSTNLGGGLIEGVRLLREARLPHGVRPRVILLTDGHANHGPALTKDDLVTLTREHAVAVGVTAFGYGDDCDNAILEAIADVGGGSFAYMANDDVVLTAFARELGGLVATYAADLRVTVTPREGAAVEERLGDLLFHGATTLVTPISIAAHVAADAVKVARVEATWHDALGRRQHATSSALLEFVSDGAFEEDDPEVARARDERLLRIAIEEAESYAERGKFEKARLVLEAVAARLQDPALIAFVHDQLLSGYESHHYAGTSGMRASNLALLKKKRALTTEDSVARVLKAEINPAEAAMEKAFRGGRRPSSGRRRKPN